MSRMLSSATNLAIYAKAGTQIASGAQLERALILAKTAQISSSLHRVEDLTASALESQNQANQLMMESNQLAIEQNENIARGFNFLSDSFANSMSSLSLQVCARLDEQLEIQVRNHSETLSALSEINNGIQSLILIAQDQRNEQRRSNLIARNPDQTKAEELFNKGKKRIQSLSLIDDQDHQKKEIIDAISEFRQAISLDPFNEQSLLQLAIWSRHIDDSNDEWIQFFREAKIRAAVELNNTDEEQRQIATNTIKKLIFCAPACMVESLRFSIYLNEFRDFCESHATLLRPEEQRTVFALGLVADLHTDQMYDKVAQRADAVFSRFGVKPLFDELLTVRSISQNEKFIRLSKEVFVKAKDELTDSIGRFSKTFN
jgi:hypothetical protein